MDSQATLMLSALAQAAGPGGICRGTVDSLLEGGEVFVSIPGDTPLRVLCDVLRVGADSTLELAPGMPVLVLLPASEDALGCVLGTVGPYVAPRGESGVAARNVVVTAEKELSLTCGQSSLTLKADGKVLLQGVDIVTRAKRNHKIKAGTVAIN